MCKFFHISIKQVLSEYVKYVDYDINNILIDDYILHIDVHNQYASVIKINKKEDNDMSVLLEKREQLLNQLTQLQVERVDDINAKIAAYKMQLESEPVDSRIIELQSVINAIDEVIAYDNTHAQHDVANTQHVSESDVQANPVMQDTAESAHDVSVNARPGMMTINTPERR